MASTLIRDVRLKQLEYCLGNSRGVYSRLPFIAATNRWQASGRQPEGVISAGRWPLIQSGHRPDGRSGDTRLPQFNLSR